MADRADLLQEVDSTLDGSGAYAGPWLDTGGLDRIRVISQDTGTAGIEESSDQTNVIFGDAVTNRGEVALTARYFRLVITGGTASSAFRAVIRKV